MHPAKSVIFFTTASGAGYGLIALVAVCEFLGWLPADRFLGLAIFTLGFGLITAGLISSTLHLGHPERAWRALSQWRSSWLSREGVAAVVTYVPTGVFAAGWVLLEETGGLLSVIGLIGAICCMATVYTTSMIYASLKTIRAWYNYWTKVNYLVLSIMTGAILLNAIARLWGLPHATDIAGITSVSILVGLIVKHEYWSFLFSTRSRSTPETATGLGSGRGSVRMLDPPHEGTNYLLHEMGFQIARKHADALRRYVYSALFVLPLIAIVLSTITGEALSVALSLLAVLFAAAGIAVERWLFFAEAKHVVTLYYGAEAA